MTKIDFTEYPKILPYVSEVMETVYGENVWVWINKNSR